MRLWFRNVNNTPSLASRYTRLTAFVSSLVIIAALISSIYIAHLKEHSADTLAMLASVKQKAKLIQQQVNRTESLLNRLLLSSTSETDFSPLLALDHAIKLTRQLQQSLREVSGSYRQDLQQVDKHLASYRIKLQEFLKLRQNLDWLYPALPFINGSMLEANQRFETASTLALSDLQDSADRVYVAEQFRLFYQLNDLWRRVVLNFRAMLVRFSGMQNVPLTASAEEKNVALLLEEIHKRLKQLADMQQKGELSFQSEDSLVEMQQAVKAWQEGFKQLSKMRLSVYWRADVEYMNRVLHPLQTSIVQRLEALELNVESLSLSEITVVDAALENLVFQFWIMTAFIVLVLMLGYKNMNKLIIQPIAKMAAALWAESTGKTASKITEVETREMDQLVQAFSAMRKQVSDRQQALEHQALHDSLTSLPNRVLLNERLEHQIQQASRESNGLALVIMDLNGFKEINDTLGHQVGDMVLINVAERIQSHIRGMDTVARLGGDEYGILLVNVDQQQATQMIERIIKSFEESMEIAGHRLHVSASMGVALFPLHGQSAKILVQRADVAMYLAKRSRKPYVVYDRDQDTHTIGWLTLPADLEQAMRNDQLQLYYQPKVHAISGELLGVEALLRWQHPRHGWVNPEDVVELAESSGMIGALTRWVITSALCDYAQFQELGIRFGIAVNLSPHNLHDPEFVEQVKTSLQRFGVPGDVLTLEITENAFISDPAQVVTVIHQLRDMGVGIAIDDYGTGFSSLSYLRQLSANELKIDKVFVMSLAENNEDMTIVRSTITMAQSLGLKVVAEGVENVASLEHLQQLGCDMLQGYYICKPLPMVDLLDWVNDWNGYPIVEQEIEQV